MARKQPQRHGRQWSGPSGIRLEESVVGWSVFSLQATKAAGLREVIGGITASRSGRCAAAHRCPRWSGYGCKPAERLTRSASLLMTQSGGPGKWRAAIAEATTLGFNRSRRRQVPVAVAGISSRHRLWRFWDWRTTFVLRRRSHRRAAGLLSSCRRTSTHCIEAVKAEIHRLSIFRLPKIRNCDIDIQ
jgi:hypothetical protein